MACLLALAAGILDLNISAQNIAWGPAIGITGDADLITGGPSVDAFLPSENMSSPLKADGITFNVNSIGSSTNKESDRFHISLVSNDLPLQFYGGPTLGDNFPTTAPSSPSFAAVMDAGGLYQTGRGTGTVTLSGLTPGRGYSVQVYSFISDGDDGYTTLSGSTPVTIGNLPGEGGTNTYGLFSTGTFTATGTTETFNWAGAGSAYTVVGAISLCIAPTNLAPTLAEDTTPNSVTANQNSTTTFTAIFNGTAPITNQWFCSTNGGIAFNQIPGATNAVLTLTNSQVVTNIEYALVAANAFGSATSTPALLTVLPPSPQTIAWGPAIGISGDNSLVTNGVYVDAFIPNTGLGAGLTVDDITFHAATSSSSTAGSDGHISFNVISGNNNPYNFTTFPSTPPSSPAFAAVINAGGTFENGGAGSGVVTISGLTAGHSYSVQVFNYANDNDQGLTTFIGTNSVTLENLPGASGPYTYGEFATGTFVATTSAESFGWIGAGSGYTILGAISVRDISTMVTLMPTNIAYVGDIVTLAVNAQPLPTDYQWQTDNKSGGMSWSNLAGANGTNYALNTADLTVGIYEFQVTVTNSSLNVTSAPVRLTVLAPSGPVILQNISPASTGPYVGEVATFTAAFTGSQPLTNQWQFSQDGGNTFSNLLGATNNTLVLNNLQPGNAGEYRLAASNVLGSNNTTAAILTVNPWSAAQIQWSAPVSLAGLNAGMALTNVPGSYLEAAAFFYDSFIPVTAGNQQYVFRSDGESALISNDAYYGGQFVTNAIYGSGALGTNSAGDASFDGVLNQYYDGGVSNVIRLNNLITGQQYAVQLFGLDNRTGTGSQLADFANAGDADDLSAQFAMGNNAYLTGTFTATNTYQTIQENLLTDGFGNINAVVVRAVSYTPSVQPVIVVQPRQQNLLSARAATFMVVADSAPAPSYQWKAGPVGGPYTNLADGGQYAGTTTLALTMFNVTTNDDWQFVVAVTNAAGGLLSDPVDLIAPVMAQPMATARPIRITCVGASDVASPTPYGTPNWPVYIASMLGYEYTIINEGVGGTTMIKVGSYPYWSTQQYTNSLNSSPDIVIIMLGSNDSQPVNWVYQTNYMHDYETLINQYRNLPSHPRIYLNTLLTAYPGSGAITDPIVTGQLCPIIRQIAFDEGLPIIDVNGATKNMTQNFPDHVHPNIAGAKVVAQTVFNGLINAGETAPMVDQALNQPVMASSVANGNVASNAVDADYTTMWQSASSNNQWIYVDLGSVLNITGVYLNWGPDYGQAYIIQVSNDANNWTSVYTNNAGSGGIDRISLNASGRYVRMLGLVSGTDNGYDLLDFTVTVPPQPPQLNIGYDISGALNLSWPVSPPSFALEATTSLLPPINWTQITNISTILNGGNYMTLTPGGNNLFFRLIQQP